MHILDALRLFEVARNAEGIKPRTVAGYVQQIGLFAETLAPDQRDLRAIRPSDITLFLNAERARGLSPATIRARDRALDIFFNWCEMAPEVASPSPMRNERGRRVLRSPRVPKKDPRRATEEQIATLLSLIPKGNWIDLRDRCLVRLLTDTGVRAGECVAAQVSDIDFTKSLLRVRSGKGDKFRLVPFSELSVKELRAYMMFRPYSRIDGEYFFLGASNEHGSPAGRLTVSGLQQMLKRRCRRAGIAYINPHSIRHLFGLTALNRGMRIEVVSKIMGHATVDFTIKFYAPLLTETLQREYNAHW